MFLCRWQTMTNASRKLVRTYLRCRQRPATFVRSLASRCSSRLCTYNTQPASSDWSLTPAHQQQCNVIIATYFELRCYAVYSTPVNAYRLAYSGVLQAYHVWIVAASCWGDIRWRLCVLWNLLAAVNISLLFSISRHADATELKKSATSFAIFAEESSNGTTLLPAHNRNLTCTSSKGTITSHFGFMVGHHNVPLLGSHKGSMTS